MEATKSNQEIFDQIYRNHRWIYGSGTGSIYLFNKPFVEFVNSFLIDHPDIFTVVDIGCGDLQIAQHFTLVNKKYIGCDVSGEILNQVRGKFPQSNREFVQLDAIHDRLPAGDLAIVKDVLLHLSNVDIMHLLQKLEQYRYVILQTNIQADCPNRDIQNGQCRSLDITRAPFNAADYAPSLQYTEGLLKPINLLLSLAGVPPIYKGVYVRF